MKKKIGIIATLDTKGVEAEFIKKQIENRGHSTIVIDTGSLGQSQAEADISREEIAKEGGKNLEELIKANRAEATQVMIKGAKSLVKKLFAEGNLDGVISLGGSTGTSIGISIMKILPIGFPKLMVCTFIYSKHVGQEDITMMQTPADILGLNRIMKRTFTLAAASIVGMVEADTVYESDKPLIGITALGVTTPAVMNIIKLLEKKGYETIVFHLKTQILDRLVEQGVIDGVLDLTPAELVKAYILKELPERKNRLGKAIEKGIPQVIVPGGLDMITLKATLKEAQADYKGRVLMEHNPYITLVRTTEDENIRLAKIIAEKANRANGLITIVIPLKGFSAVDKLGHNFYDPVIIKSFIKTIESNIKKEVNLFKVDAHINDEKFAQKLVEIYENDRRRR